LLAGFIVTSIILIGGALAPSEAAVPSFIHSGYRLNRTGASPYIGPHVVPLDNTTWGKVGADGVLQVTINGKQVYHPVSSAWWMNQMISSYKVTGDKRYLDRVIKTAQYLIRYSVSDQNGTWFPYRFDYEHDGFRLKAPWVSGMAQGMMLSTFVNLYDVTKNPYWRTWADRTYKTYKAPKSAKGRWFQDVRLVNGKKFLSFEEYPAVESQISHVVNGNIYAMYGLYDYYRLTGSSEALWFFDTAASSLRDTFLWYRNPGRPSWYAATPYGWRIWGNPAGYHKGVTSQLRIMADLTKDRRFTDEATTLFRDSH